MANPIWFGTVDGPLAKMQNIKAPATGMEAGSSKIVETLEFSNGGMFVSKSADARRTFSMDWRGSDNDQYSIDEILNYYHGEYGQGYIYWADPLQYDQNLLRRNWASPALIETGYRNIAPVQPTFSDTPANIYSQPGRTATWALDGTPGRTHTIPIPPGYTCWVGASGSATGTAAVEVIQGGTGTITALSLISPTGISTNTNLDGGNASSTYTSADYIDGGVASSTYVGTTNYDAGNAAASLDTGARMNYSVNEIPYIRIRVNGTGDLTLTSMMVQLLPTGIEPTSTSHIRGLGTSGLMFANDAQPYNYTMANNRVRGLSADFVEVEEWLN